MNITNPLKAAKDQLAKLDEAIAAVEALAHLRGEPLNRVKVPTKKANVRRRSPVL